MQVDYNRKVVWMPTSKDNSPFNSRTAYAFTATHTHDKL